MIAKSLIDDSNLGMISPVKINCILLSLLFCLKLNMFFKMKLKFGIDKNHQLE